MTERPDVAVLDGDILCYRAAFWADQEGVEYLEERLEHDIKAWTPAGMTKTYIAMSCSRKDNYRRDFWEAYKAHRDVRKQTPDSMDYALELINQHDILTVPRLEADDIMGIMASSGKGIAVTIDKDLRSVPGWHWNPDKEHTPDIVDEYTADLNFHKQWIMGDTTDNIPGIWKWGPAKAEKWLKYVHPRNWSAAVLAAYDQAKPQGGTKYDYDYCLAMARCVRILRDGEYDKQTKQIKLYCPIVGATEEQNQGDTNGY
jgi:DNA polymerase-1